MRGVYTIGGVFSITTAQTLVYVICPATIAIKILGCRVTNQDAATNQQMGVGLFHVATIGSPSGTPATPEKHEPGDVASLLTGGLTALSGEPTYQARPVHSEGVASLNGYRVDFTPETAPVVPPSKAAGLRLLTTVTAITARCEIDFLEMS